LIIYTIVPHELIFDREQDFTSNQENFYYNGILVTAERMTPNRYKIVSIWSTDPNDYLNIEMQPGKMIEIPLFQNLQ